MRYGPGPTRGKKRRNDAVPYGDGADALREALARDGVVEVYALLLAKPYLTTTAISSACKAEERRGNAVKLFRGVWARPDVVFAVHVAIANAVAGLK